MKLWTRAMSITERNRLIRSQWLFLLFVILLPAAIWWVCLHPGLNGDTGAQMQPMPTLGWVCALITAAIGLPCWVTRLAQVRAALKRGTAEVCHAIVTAKHDRRWSDEGPSFLLEIDANPPARSVRVSWEEFERSHPGHSVEVVYEPTTRMVFAHRLIGDPRP